MAGGPSYIEACKSIRAVVPRLAAEGAATQSNPAQ